MFNVRIFVFITMLLLAGSLTHGQTTSKTITIKGALADSLTKAPIPFATVVVTQTDKKVIQSTLTDEKGSFLLKTPEKTNLVLYITYVGYNTYSAAIAPVAGLADLGRIYLAARTGVLNEVVVNGKKPIIQSMGDKLIYNAASDIGNKSGSAEDVLRKAPMVTVSPDGEIKLRGNGNIKILLNGLPSGLLAKNLKEALKMIPASSIESIEVITSPSAKYEAEGAAGVINITTKKKMNGTGGSIDLSAGNLEQMVSGSLNMTKGKFSVNLNLDGGMEKARTVTDLDRTSLSDGISIGRLIQTNDETQKSKGAFGILGVEYRVDSSQKIGASVSYWNGNWPSESQINSLYSDKKGVTAYNQYSEQKGQVNYTEFSLNYQKKFKRPAQELQLVTQYSKANEQASYMTDQFDLSGQRYFREISPNTGYNKEFFFQADYVQPLDRAGNHLLEVGGRYSKNNSSSDYTVFTNNYIPGSAIMIEDPSRANVMSYFQDIAAGYLNLKIKTRKDWQFRLGGRYEHTSLGGDFKGPQPSFRSQFNNFVSSVMVNKRINDIHDLKLSYTERIRRPWIWDLNPYVNASDPRNLTFGNPELRPEINRMLELVHNYTAPSGFNLNSSLYFHSNSNTIESLRTVDSLGISRTTQQNIASNRRLGGNVFTGLQFNKSWTMTLGAEFYHVWFKSKALNIGNDASFYSFSINSAYELPKDFTLQFSGDYSNGYVTLQGRTTANYTYRLSARKEFWDKKAGITLSFNNPFQQSFLQRSTATAPSFNSNTTSWYYNRSFSVAFSWKFGTLRSSGDNEKEMEEGTGEKGPRRGRSH
ncbi:outer membrane beta-barrel family protein [Chitinophaga flava]|uniref:TonB-dependent receptor n=1 Tax=Chitinophaga flava TaxID=2259036 RepID=A0A365XTY8_9BACT|nr:outer membrane beta-barrel family protein [Chitinophaga flava]RBL89481.1 TonB-dependent receptor [Chitinophaga flava]